MPGWACTCGSASRPPTCSPDSRVATAQPAGQAVVDRFGEPGDWTQSTVAREWRPPHPQLLGKLLRTPWKVRPEALLGVAMPTGRKDTELWTSALRAGAGTVWPTDPLWICAVRMDDACRVVFGRTGAPHTDVATAVGASSAIPGYFAPVTIHGRRYVDGGVHSPTNADVLRHEELDLVIVSSPMSISNNAEPAQAVARAARSLPRAARHRDAASCGAPGIVTRVFQPSEDDLRVMGNQAMDDDRMAAVARQARETTLRRLAERPLELGHVAGRVVSAVAVTSEAVDRTDVPAPRRARRRRRGRRRRPDSRRARRASRRPPRSTA